MVGGRSDLHVFILTRDLVLKARSYRELGVVYALAFKVIGGVFGKDTNLGVPIKSSTQLLLSSISS